MLEDIINYKKKIASRFIPIEGGGDLSDIPVSDVYIYSEKLDGHLAFVWVKNNDVELYNRSGIKLDIPEISQAFKLQPQGIWAGELFIKDAPRSRSFEVASAIANQKDKLGFAVFDAVHELSKPIFDRIQIVQKSITINDKISIVNWNEVATREDLTAAYNEVIKKSGEGIIVHTPMGFTYKIKPFVEIDVTVLGYSLRDDDDGVRSLLVGIKNDDYWLIVATVGSGFSDMDRLMWQSKLEPLKCESDFIVVSSNKLAYQWVKPQVVIQVKCIEIISEDYSGLIKKEALRFDGNQYDNIGKTNSVSLISPVLIAERKDKEANEEDTGMNQIASRIEISKENIASIGKVVASDILFREVYIKSSKNGDMVRKFIGVKTNKENTFRFPAYYLFYTDFSSGRKEPLQTEISVTNSEEKLYSILETMMDENVKKGWNKVN